MQFEPLPKNVRVLCKSSETADWNRFRCTPELAGDLKNARTVRSGMRMLTMECSWHYADDVHLKPSAVSGRRFGPLKKMRIRLRP